MQDKFHYYSYDLPFNEVLPFLPNYKVTLFTV